MPVNQYPEFEKGQTLTEDELNLLRDFLDDRDRLVARMVGFGVNCGLEGEISSGQLLIGGGLAIDQRGEPLLLEADATLSLPPSTSGSFDFISSGPGGYSVVLRMLDEDEPAPDCGDDGCEGHAILHTRTAVLQVVPGRLSGESFDFSKEPLLDLTPLMLTLTSNPVGSFNTLRDAIHGRIASKIQSSLAGKLASISIATADLPAIKAFKAAWLNQVYFAALDLLRCEGLMQIACERTTATPGVVLGWLHQSGPTWTWDCDYRHHWEPPTGLSMALLGGSCDSPCKPYVNHLEELISNFEVPVVPAPADPPSGGGVSPGDYTICPGGICDDIYVYPPYKIPDWWIEVVLPEVPYPPEPPWGGVIQLEEVYGIDPIYWLNTPVIGLQPAWGGNAIGVKDALDKLIKDQGIEPNVVIVSAGGLKSVDGYHPTGAANLGDTVVLTTDALGKVIGTGHVSGLKAVRNVGTQLPIAVETAKTALVATDKLSGEMNLMGGKMETFGNDIGGLKTFQAEMQGWKAGADTAFAGLDEMVLFTVQQQFGSQMGVYSERMARLEGGIETDRAALQQTQLRMDQIVSGKYFEIRQMKEFNQNLISVFDSMRSSIQAVAAPTRIASVKKALAKGDPAMKVLEERSGAALLIDEKEALTELVDSFGSALKATGLPAAEMRDFQRQINGFKAALG